MPRSSWTILLILGVLLVGCEDPRGASGRKGGEDEAALAREVGAEGSPETRKPASSPAPARNDSPLHTARVEVATPPAPPAPPVITPRPNPEPLTATPKPRVTPPAPQVETARKALPEPKPSAPGKAAMVDVAAQEPAPKNPLPTPTPALVESTAVETKPPPAPPAPLALPDPPAARNDSLASAGTLGEAAALPGPTLLSSVRAGQHEGYDRLVFEFPGKELPLHDVHRLENSGYSCRTKERMAVVGESWLVVSFFSAQAVGEGDQPGWLGEKRFSFPALREMELACNEAGRLTWILGLASAKRFRVTELAHPTRLVVDILY